MVDLVERLRDHYRTDVGMAGETATDIADAAAEIERLRTSLSQEREAREKERFLPLGDNHHNAMKCPYCNPEQIDPGALKAELEAEKATGAELFRLGIHHQKRAEAAEASLAEAKRLLKPFADIGEIDFSGTAWANQTSEASVLYHYASDKKIALGDFQEAARFLAQEAEPSGVKLMREALADVEETLRLVERPATRDPSHGDEVEALGLRIGFGALMSSASASWREHLKADGYPVGGEFVAGPCHGSIVKVLAKIRAALSFENGAGAPPPPEQTARLNGSPRNEGGGR